MKFMKNKTFIIVGSVCLVLLFLIVFAIYRMFFPSNKSVYGDRLSNAPEIDNAVIEQIKTKISDTNLTEDVKYQTNSVIMKFFITVKDDTKLSDAQNLSTIITDNLSDKLTEFYDVEIYLINEGNSDYPSIGYRSKSADSFTWINNVGDVSEE